MRRLLVILASLSALLLAAPLSATNYFVTESGAGSQNGSSLANAWSVANYNASGAPTGGDTVFFSGTITSGLTLPTSGTGNGAARLTLDFSGSCGGCSVVTFATSGNTINMNSKNFITLNGGNANAAPTGGATFPATSSTQISCKAAGGVPETGHDYTIQGFIYIGPTGGTGDFFQGGRCSNVLLQNNWGDNLGHLVNYFQGSVSNITVLNNFGRTSTDTTTDDDVLQIADAVNVTITGNKLIDQSPGSACCHQDVIQTFHSGSTTSQNPSNWVINFNWIETAQPSGGGGNMSWMEMEQFTGNPGLVIYGNVFVGTGVPQSGGNGISIHNTSSVTDYFYNNTVWRHQMPLNPIRLGENDGAGTVNIKNNATGADAAGQSWQVTYTIASVGNNFNYQLGGCPGSCSALTPAAFTHISTNCQLNCSDDFSGARGSVLINAGDSSIGAPYNQGICPGATWPNPALCTRSSGAWDVGAFQQGTTTSAVNPPANLSVTVQ